MEGVEEVRREKVFVPSGMTTKQIREKYDFDYQSAWRARNKGYFVRNYSRPQVRIDPSRFDPDICYRIAGKVFKTNLSHDPVAVSIRQDLIQEAVKSMWEKSGILIESKYSVNYQYYFIARNYMNSYLSKWKNQMRYCTLFEDLVKAVKQKGRRVYDPVFGWVYC